MERDKYFSSLLFSTCEELNFFVSSETQKKILSSDMSENMSVVSLSLQKTVWIARLGSELMVSEIDLKFTFYSTIYIFAVGARRGTS